MIFTIDKLIEKKFYLYQEKIQKAVAGYKKTYTFAPHNQTRGD
jgi:hypothetical protein